MDLFYEMSFWHETKKCQSKRATESRAIPMRRSMKLACVAALALIASSISEVIVGTEKNWDALIKDNKFVLAEFYAP